MTTTRGWQVGDTLTEFVDDPLTATDIVRYQGASGDFTSFHHDEAVARAAGYPSVFSVGMLQAGILGTYVAETFGPESVRRFGVRFDAQVWPGDVLTYRGRVVAAEDRSDGRAVDLELSVDRQNGTTHITGWATVLLLHGPGPEGRTHHG
ncbi:dihydroxy-acid dehydratase [Pseudonocardia ailaonensis]|uniref:Dihydroxy-acid dehydratase n=1 Tax=Pseudonocardia ailaonensis TaxID=367279 RepID=A0ABN2MZD0_9PSEU